MDDNIVRLPPRLAGSAAVAQALSRASTFEIAEMNRKMCLEAAASWADNIRGIMEKNPELLIKASTVAKLFDELAKGIRQLKMDDAFVPPPGGAA